MPDRTLTFITHAHTRVGFGHVSRCLYLARALKNDFSIQFCGEFANEAVAMIEAFGYTAQSSLPNASARSFAVIDRMFDPEDMDAVDRAFLRKMRNAFSRTVLISSAMTVPNDLPVDVVIGDHAELADGSTPSFRFYQGFAYAPVDPSLLQYRRGDASPRERIETIFVGLGGSQNTAGIIAVLDGLAAWQFQGEAHLLLSPLHAALAPSLKQRRVPYRLSVHERIPSVGPLLQNVDVAIVSYGNLMYEALCVGAPALVLAVKEFQVRYAEQCAKQGLVIAAGSADTLAPSRLCAILQSLGKETRETLSVRGQTAIDGRGIERIAQIIKNRI